MSMCFFSKIGVFITLSMSKFQHSTIQLSIRGSSPRALKLVNNCSPALLWMLRRFCSNTIEQSNQMFSLWLIILPLYKQKQPLLVQHTCALCRDRILLFENTYKWIELHLYIVKNSNYIHVYLSWGAEAAAVWWNVDSFCFRAALYQCALVMQSHYNPIIMGNMLFVNPNGIRPLLRRNSNQET